MNTKRMDYRIVVDTGCDLEREEEKRLGVLSVPFKIDIEDQTFIDDESLDLSKFMALMLASKEPIKTACPSPLEYEERLEKAKESDGIFVFTLSKKLSGSYNAAKVAVDSFAQKYPDKPIALIDTQSASAGQSNILYKTLELMDKGLEFEEIKREIESFIETMQTFFILESLENLKKNGRIRKSAGLIASALNIKPIMRDNGAGDIELFQMNRGFKKSLKKLSEYIIEEYKKTPFNRLTISHSNALVKAVELKDKLLEQVPIETIQIIHTRGLSTGYADIGGIVVAF